MAVALSFLSTGPNIAKIDSKLVANTSLFFTAITLGSCIKSFEADPQARMITYSIRFLWLFKRTWRIPFDDVHEFHYRYSNLMPLSSISAEDSIDSYSVVIETKDHDEIILFRWIGQGEFENNTYLPDWMYWEERMFDLTGTQKSESLGFFELLKAMVFPKGMINVHLVGNDSRPEGVGYSTQKPVTRMPPPPSPTPDGRALPPWAPAAGQKPPPLPKPKPGVKPAPPPDQL